MIAALSGWVRVPINAPAPAENGPRSPRPVRARRRAALGPVLGHAAELRAPPLHQRRRAAHAFSDEGLSHRPSHY